MTSIERIFLLDQKRIIQNLASNRLEMALVFGWVWLSFGGILYLFGLITIKIIEWVFSPGWPEGMLNCLIAYVAWAIASMTVLWTLLGEYRSHNRRNKTLRGIDADLSANEVEEERFSIQEVICLLEQEHLMRIYLLKTTDGRIRVRYDYDSADTSGTGKSRRTNLKIWKDVRMVSFPHSKQVMYHEGDIVVRKPKATDLALAPKHWPEDETWLDMEWDEVRPYYSGHLE